MLVTLASHRSSPGVTTTALSLARLAGDAGYDEIVVIEADPDGSVIRHLRPDLNPDQTVQTFGVAARRRHDNDQQLIWEHTQPLLGDDHIRIMLGADTGVQVVRALTLAHDTLVRYATDPSRLMIVDCGRLSGQSAHLYHAGHVRYLLVRSTAADVLSYQTLVNANPKDAETLSLVLVGSDPYGPDDLADIGLNVAAVLPIDPQMAAALATGEPVATKKASRSSLIRALTTLVPPPGQQPDHSEVDGPLELPAQAHAPQPDAEHEPFEVL